jgi:hypothetical protein
MSDGSEGEDLLDRRRISIPSWAFNAATALVAIVLATVGTVTWMSSQYITRTEWSVNHDRLADDAKTTAISLNDHLAQTRLDAARLATIEAHLSVIREDLNRLTLRLERPTRGNNQ